MIKIYEIPADGKWSPGKPKPADLEKYECIVLGDNDMVYKRFIDLLNNDKLGLDVNYYYVDEVKEPILYNNRVVLDLRKTCKELAIDHIFQELKNQSKIKTWETKDNITQLSGDNEIEVLPQYTDIYEKWYKHYETILKNNFTR